MQAGPTWIDLVTGPVVIALAAAAFLLLAGFVVVRLFLNRRSGPVQPQADLTLDLASLGTTGPEASNVVLECHNVPVRLAAVVLAPVGRGALPSADRLADLMDFVTPGLSSVLASHRPQVKRWPAQLSPRGFANTFFANLHLPGDRGKGTPWCAVAGRVEGADQGLMLGLLLRAAAANGLGQMHVERMQDWLDVLKVRGG